MTEYFLNPRRLLVQEASLWLERRARATAVGVKTLDHILVVVPTRQAGRRLRVALAQRLGACVPPRIALPASLLASPETAGLAVATEAESLGVLASLLETADLSEFPALFPKKAKAECGTFSWRLGIARQLHDVWRILGENALTMGDVASSAERGQVVFPVEEELDRWRELAALEKRLFAALREQQRCHAAEARQKAVALLELPHGVEEIVLPALVDAQPAFFRALEGALSQSRELAVTLLLHAEESERDRFDAWGRPVPEAWSAERAPDIPLRKGQYVLAANSAEQAEAVAELIARVDERDELPGIGLADEELFYELQTALLARGKRLHNPASVPLLHSSLGHIVAQLSRLLSDSSYAVFASWLRESDTQRYFEKTLAPGAPLSFLDVLSALDALHKRHLPQTFSDVHAHCRADPAWRPLREVADVVKGWLEPRGRSRADHLRDILKELFSARLLREQNAGDRELLAAAQALNDVIAAAECELVRRVLPDEAQRAALFESLLNAASYSLEPDDPEAVLTDGWLELAWNPSPELAVCGFNEESVPESVVGHAFVPDSLRKALGLPHNEQRTARDTYLFRSLLQARAPGAVTVLLERVNARGDVRKPSRLLLLCGDDDAAFAARVRELYKDSDKPAKGHARTLPDAWRLKLPIPVSAADCAPPAEAALPVPAGWPTVSVPPRLSVTAFKDYLACPFSFFLKHLVKMKRCDDRDRELDQMDFGALCHSVLESFGRWPRRDSPDPEEVERYLHAELARRMKEQFGSERTTVLRLQEESLRQRFSFFAKKQAEVAQAGWRILQPEITASITVGGMAVKGKIDRLDYHEGEGCRILDYKTWGERKGESSFCTSSKKLVEQAAARGLPNFSVKADKKPAVWTDLQLPLYRRLSGALGDVIPPGVSRFACGYWVLGDTEADTACETWDFDLFKDSSDAAILHVVERVQAGIFWPIVSLSKDFLPLFPDQPEEGVSREWIADQEARLARLPPATKQPPGEEPQPCAAKKAPRAGRGKKA